MDFFLYFLMFPQRSCIITYVIISKLLEFLGSRNSSKASGQLQRMCYLTLHAVWWVLNTCLLSPLKPLFLGKVFPLSSVVSCPPQSSGGRKRVWRASRCRCGVPSPGCLTFRPSGVRFSGSQSYFAPGKIHYKQQHMGHWRVICFDTHCFFQRERGVLSSTCNWETGWTVC